MDAIEIGGAFLGSGDELLRERVACVEVLEGSFCGNEVQLRKHALALAQHIALETLNYDLEQGRRGERRAVERLGEGSDRDFPRFGLTRAGEHFARRSRLQLWSCLITAWR